MRLPSDCCGNAAESNDRGGEEKALPAGPSICDAGYYEGTMPPMLNRNTACQVTTGDKSAEYAALGQELAAVVAAERDFLANMANCAAMIFLRIPQLNWAGFYLLKENQLVLGPFQGKPACVRIALGRGVCGTAARQRRTVVVGDVAQFPGHIACDSASKSEIVVPLIAQGELVGVLDVDSPVIDRFDQTDAAGLENVAAILLRASEVRNVVEKLAAPAPTPADAAFESDCR